MRTTLLRGDLFYFREDHRFQSYKAKRQKFHVQNIEKWGIE